MNIIHLVADEMRADVLGCYGHPLSPTPHLDALAAQGTRFDQCHVQNPVCTPSRCSFMTGWYVSTRGHRSLWNCLQPHEPNLLHDLHRAGYDVHWFGKNDLLSPEALRRSGAVVHEWWGSGDPARPWPPADPRFQAFLQGPMTTRHHDEMNVDNAVRYLRARRPGHKPFMLYLPLIMPHCPYTCPEPWYSQHRPEQVPELRPAGLAGKPDFHDLIRRYRGLDQLPESELRRVAAIYLGMNSWLDSLVGRLTAALAETGLDGETALFVYSDHGDWAGDYGLVEKWPSALDDCLTRIPLIARIPGGKAGHVVREPVECFDVMATTLELAGVQAGHHHYARSLVAQLHGAAGDPGRAVFAEGGYEAHEAHCFEGKPEDGVAADPGSYYYAKALQQQEHPASVCRATMIRTATHKLIRRPGGRSELYDLAHDPRELVNRHDDPALAAVRLELEGRLLDWYVRCAGSTDTRPDPRGFPREILQPVESCDR